MTLIHNVTVPPIRPKAWARTGAKVQISRQISKYLGEKDFYLQYS